MELLWASVFILCLLVALLGYQIKEERSKRIQFQLDVRAFLNNVQRAVEGSGLAELPAYGNRVYGAGCIYDVRETNKRINRLLNLLGIQETFILAHEARMSVSKSGLLKKYSPASYVEAI